MEEVAFFAGAIGALGGAIAVIALRNPFYSVLALIVHLFALAGLFLLLHAEFVAAAQIVVYAGAVMVLYVFVAAYVGNVDEPLWEPIPGQRILAPLLGLALFIELSIAVLGTALKTFGSEGPTIQTSFGSPTSIGELLLEEFLIAFEAASLLLLIAAVGAVVLAGRRPEPEPATGPAGRTTVTADPDVPGQPWHSDESGSSARPRPEDLGSHPGEGTEEYPPPSSRRSAEGPGQGEAT
jgi:NADH:ubiquinone oxidoreductase subunit 6 (subunit J)